ncbi:MAG: hypothetical protein IKB07_12405 [Lachnospiraceae bacterium]|nr:hypothetical protein [Lachnospiraceae bacterium]
MKKSKWLIVWSISLMVIAVCTLVLTIANIMGASIPDVLIRILGTIDGITCPILIVATVRMYNKEREQKTEEIK